MAAKHSKKEKSEKGKKTKGINAKLQDIQSRRDLIKENFEEGKIKYLKDIEYLISDNMAKELGIHRSRLIYKLYNPIKFSFKDAYRFALYVGFDPKLMITQITKEISKNKSVLTDLSKFKSISEIL